MNHHEIISKRTAQAWREKHPGETSLSYIPVFTLINKLMQIEEENKICLHCIYQIKPLLWQKVEIFQFFPCFLLEPYPVSYFLWQNCYVHAVLTLHFPIQRQNQSREISKQFRIQFFLYRKIYISIWIHCPSLSFVFILLAHSWSMTAMYGFL